MSAKVKAPYLSFGAVLDEVLLSRLCHSFRSVGLDVWTSSRYQPCRFLVDIWHSTIPNCVRLTPHFVPSAAPLHMTPAAIEVVLRMVLEREGEREIDELVAASIWGELEDAAVLLSRRAVA